MWDEELTALNKMPRGGGGSDQGSPAVTAHGSPIVLVAEQDPAVADTLAMLLENSGYRPVVTSDGMTALCQVRDGGVDLVLLDRDLPGPTGLTLCREMRAAARDAEVHLPI